MITTSNKKNKQGAEVQAAKNPTRKAERKPYNTSVSYVESQKILVLLVILLR